jgi:hypothetical protein
MGADQLRHQVSKPRQLLVQVRPVQQSYLHNSFGEASMTKEEALKLIKLLSAMESWAFSTKTALPDYLHEDLCLAVERLEKIVLEKPCKS